MWAWVFPAIVAANAVLGAFIDLRTLWLLLLIPVGYFVLAWRVRKDRVDRCGDDPSDARRYGVLTALGKFPSAAGHRQYFRHKRRGGAATLIEYKGQGGANA